VAFVIPLWRLLTPFFTPAFPSDSRTLSPPSLFDADLSIMTQSYWLLALLGHPGPVDFAMLVIHSDNVLNSPPPRKQGTCGHAAKRPRDEKGLQGYCRCFLLVMFADVVFLTAAFPSDSGTLSRGFAFQPGSLNLDSELFAAARLDALDSFVMHVLWIIVALVFCCN
jgi:hypothetical protein